MNAEIVFMAKGLTKVYEMGEVNVWALRGIDLELSFAVIRWRAAAHCKFMPKPVSVDTTAAFQGPLCVTIEEGRTRVKDRYVVSAPVMATCSG